MKKDSEDIPGYSYGEAGITRSSITVKNLESLKVSAGFTDEDEKYLRLAGDVLKDQTRQIVEHWRAAPHSIILPLETEAPSPKGTC